MRTICEIIEETMSMTQDEGVKTNLAEVMERAGRMEDRLLAYCNAIESLGFERTGRDYEKQ